jgi:hypothetical protein
MEKYDAIGSVPRDFDPRLRLAAYKENQFIHPAATSR